MKWRKPYPPRRPHWLKGSGDWTSAKSGFQGSGSNGYESVPTSHQEAAGFNGSTDWYGFNGPLTPAEFGFPDDSRWEDRPGRQFPRVPLPRSTLSFWGKQPSGFCSHPYRRPSPENAWHAFDGLPPPDFFPHPPHWAPEITESREMGHGSHVNRPFSADAYGSYGTPVGVPPQVFFPETTSPHPPRWAPAVTGTRAMDREYHIDRSRPFSAFAMFAYNASVSPLLLVDPDPYRTLSRRPESPVINQHPQAHRDSSHSSEELVKPKHLNELPKNPQPDAWPEVIYLSDDDEQKSFLPMIFTDQDVKVVKVVGPKKKNTVRSGKSTVPIGNFDWSTSTKKTVVTAPSGEGTVEDGNDQVTETQSTVQQETAATTTMTAVDVLESTVPSVKSDVPTMATTVGAMEMENTVASVESAGPTTIPTTTVDAMESTVAPASPSASAIKTEMVDLQVENVVPSTTTNGVIVDKSPEQTTEQVERRFVDDYGKIHASEGYTVNNYSTMEDEEGGVRTVTVQMVFHKT